VVDQFQAFLLLLVTGLFVYIVIRVVRDDLERARRSRKPPVLPPRSQPPP
jgi:hypothetical protein